ncbi:MAG TPA: hypothetical protein VEO54_06985 [Thermoanaerobaculia bacterium]|nr:hypothetical protein [Thermoanaerobaculia bacterium]
MNDLTYELQRMASRRLEIEQATKKNGADAAWEKYSREHGLDQRRFKTDLKKLRSRFDGIASGRDSEDSP